MEQVGFTRTELGVPCFLDPVRRSDYLQPSGLGCPRQEDGKDTFQHCMNGAVNASPALHFLAPHYVAGDPEPADKFLRQILAHLNAGKFQHGVTDQAPKGFDLAQSGQDTRKMLVLLKEVLRIPKASKWRLFYYVGSDRFLRS